MKGRMVWRMLVALFAILSVVGSVYMANRGFRGTLPTFMAGLGWAFVTLSIFFSAVVDVVKAIGAVVEFRDAR